MQQELREREEVEKELGLVKGWIQDTRGLLLSPTADLDSLLQELEVGRYMNTTICWSEWGDRPADFITLVIKS